MTHPTQYPLLARATEADTGGAPSKKPRRGSKQDGKQGNARGTRNGKGVEIPGRPASSNPLAAQRLSGAPLIAGLALILGMTLCTVLAYFVALAPANSTHREALAEVNATQLTAHVQSVMKDLRQELITIGRLPDVQAAAADQDSATLAALENRYLGLIPGALRMRITAAQQAQVALEDDPPLTFAGLQLIRQAESGTASNFEASAADGRVLINIAAPVAHPVAGNPVGSVHVVFPASALLESAKGLEGAVGRLTLVQRIGTNPALELGALGSAGGNSGPTLVTRLDNPNWETLFTPSPRITTAAPASGLGLVLAIAVALAVALAGLYVGYARLYTALAHDLDKLLESLTAFVSGRALVPARDYTLDALAGAGAVLNTLAADYSAPSKDSDKTDVPKFDIKRPEPGAAEQPILQEVLEDDEDEDEDSDDFLDIENLDVDEEDDNLDDTVPEAVKPEPPPAEIFRAYDIRGIVGDTLTEQGAYLIGRAVGSEAAERGEKVVAVGRDGRHSSPKLAQQMIRGIASTGRNVIDIGDVPTPMLYFACEVTEARSGVMVTGSHNPPDYNGFKIVIASETLAGARITALRERIAAGRFVSGPGEARKQDLTRDYIDRIASDIAIAHPLKVVADCGNGIAGRIVPELLEALGCEVIPLYCDVDGDFPNHHPDPNDPKNLEDLMTVVRAEGADIGVAFDGDGDRLGVVTEKGQIIWPDRLLMLFSQDIVSRNPGADVIFDVKCSRHLNSLIAEYGGRPIMWKTGHSHMKAKLRETGALLAGEFSGHICFGERWFGFDDGLYSAARLLEIIGSDGRSVSEIFAEFPDAVNTPELKIPTSEDAKFRIIEQLAAGDGFADGDITTIDGLRVDYPDGWGLIRPSNTAPVLTLRFEADDRAALDRIQDKFRAALATVDPALKFQA